MVGVANQRIPHTTLHAAHYYDMSFSIGLLLFAAQLSWSQTACNADHIFNSARNLNFNFKKCM
jgi:hypothetical protein